MANPFQLIVERLTEIGVYDYLFPMIIFWAVFFALLKKTKIFGDSVVIYATLSLVLSFFIWAYAATLPAMAIGGPMSKFIVQVFIIILVVSFGLIGGSLAYPDFSETLKRAFGESNAFLWIFLVTVIIVLFATSGLGSVLRLGDTIFKGEGGGIFLLLLMLFLGLAFTVVSVIPPKR
ncbi:MAG: hypothetical protein QXM68_03585 [Candidatus Aenigmatarchaeota archaeon]|nr:hypothetical protein [Candidatus Aenigmarchaeota archaeon]